MKKIDKAYEITDAKIQFVSLVDKAANKRKFLLKKAEDGQAAFTTYGRIIKADKENHYITGIVYEPMEEDSHGNYMTEEEITKAAYWFAKNGDKVDLQHSFEPLGTASVVENWVAKADFKIDGEKIRKGTWLMTVEVSDPDVWENIEKGEITGLSMGGLGNYSMEDVKLDNVSKQETSAKKGLLKQLAGALGINVVEKGAMAEFYEERSKGTLFWNAFNSLEDILYKYDPITERWHYEKNESKVRECLEDFNQIVTRILTDKESVIKAIQTEIPVVKAGKKISGRNKDTLVGIYESLGTFLKEFDERDDDDKTKTDNNREEKEMTKQEVSQTVEEAITKAMAAHGAAAKAETGAAEITEEAVEKMVETAVAKALEPPKEAVTAEQVGEMITAAVAKAVDPILKSKGLPSNLNENEIEKSAEVHYLHGII